MMLKSKYYFLMVFLGIIFLSSRMNAQKVGFISSDDIRKNFPEAKQAEQRLKSIVEEWKRELQSYKDNIASLEDEIKKNRLVWTDQERYQKESELKDLKKSQRTFAKNKFEAGGEYDHAVKMLMKKVEEKIYAATQKVAAEQGFDIIFDKSVQPLPYVNFKYDLTVKVLRELGVDTKKLEEELNAKISKDPRNKQRKHRKAPSRRRKRSRRKILEQNPVPEKVNKTKNPIQNKLPDSLGTGIKR